MATRVRTPNVVVPLQSLFEVMSDGVLITDEAGIRTYSNRALNRLVGSDAREPIGSTEPPDWLPPDQHDRYRKYLRLVAGGKLGQDMVSLEWAVRDHRGATVPTVLKLLPVRNGSQHPAAALWLFVPSYDGPEGSGERQRRLEDGVRRIAAEVTRLGYALDSVASPAPLEAFPQLDVLSRRERQVLDQLLEGHRVVSIADQLCVSEHTVRNHLKSIFRKLDVHSQAELVGFVRGNGRHD